MHVQLYLRHTLSGTPWADGPCVAARPRSVAPSERPRGSARRKLQLPRHARHASGRRRRTHGGAGDSSQSTGAVGESRRRTEPPRHHGWTSAGRGVFLFVLCMSEHPTSPVSFGEDIVIRWSLLSGVYVRGSMVCYADGKCATCRGLPSSRETWTLR